MIAKLTIHNGDYVEERHISRSSGTSRYTRPLDLVLIGIRTSNSGFSEGVYVVVGRGCARRGRRRRLGDVSLIRSHKLCRINRDEPVVCYQEVNFSKGCRWEKMEGRRT